MIDASSDLWPLFPTLSKQGEKGREEEERKERAKRKNVKKKQSVAATTHRQEAGIRIRRNE